jgi:2,4-dienoyl-CoA reductase-like NADH-dependent reductase (Old Yellow Enzyme family)
MEHISKPLTLKCGLNLPNRLVKSAMAERMAGPEGLPHDAVYRAYSKWAEGGWGMILTGMFFEASILQQLIQKGNVFVDSRYLGMRDEHSIPIPIGKEGIATLAQWNQKTSFGGTPTLVQLNHAGRQSGPFAGTRSFFAKTIAPSAVPMDIGSGIVAWITRVLLFGTPRAMTSTDIETVIEQFVYSAKLVAEAGFAGVELHAAHGYLLSQFLSSSANLRQDEWGGDATRRVKIVAEIIKRVKEATPQGFAVGVKLNSADHQSDQAMEDALAQMRIIANAGVDFVNISGGLWEEGPQV